MNGVVELRRLILTGTGSVEDFPEITFFTENLRPVGIFIGALSRPSLECGA